MVTGGSGGMASSPHRFTRRTTSEEVASRLREEILRGDLEPGKRLRQGAVATRFGVSTTPVREAFALLQAEGLVHRMEEATDEEMWASMNTEFHRRLYSASGRPRLLSMIETLRDASSTY